MTIELSPQLRELPIPPQNDARGTDLHISDAFDAARRTADNLNMGGLAADAGLINTNTGAARQNEFDNIKEREKRNKQSRETQDALRRIAEIDAQLNELYKIGEKIDQDIKDTKDRIKVLDKAIADPASVDVDADGNIKDPDIAKAVDDYKKRTGKDVDATDTADLQVVLIAQRKHEQSVLGGHHERKQDNDSKIDDLKRERSRQVEIIEKANPNANVEELIEKFKKEDDAVSISAESYDNTKLAESAVINITDNASEENIENFSYDPFADTLEGDGETFRKSTDLDTKETPQKTNTQITLDNGFNQEFSIPKI
jgi:hypothetical protein